MDFLFWIFIIVTVLLVITVILFSVYYLLRIRQMRREYDEQVKKLNATLKYNSDWELGLLRSQVQPQFIYDGLNTIKYLCKNDPKSAIEVIDMLSDFLQKSMEAFSLPECIPFEDEMDIVKRFVFLEHKRLGYKVNVEYDMGYTDFKIPALSLLSMVENAVKHGITRQIGGGRIWIVTRKEPRGVLITITDNGVGFYADAKINDGKSHVGIEYTRNRLELMCNGTLKVESEQGKQTVVSIFIPDVEKESVV